MTNELEVVEADWEVPKNVIAFSTTRNGGFSLGDYDSFNLGAHVGDQRKTVLKNRELLKSHYNLPTEPSWLEQTHSTNILELDSPDFELPCADGSLTSSANIVCAVMTADCLPLFLSNKAGTKIGVIHAGWLGIANGIIEKAVTKMAVPVDQLITWAGPCISQKHFEVGDEVRQQLGGSNKCYSASNNKGKCNANLYCLARERLTAMGVQNYNYSDACTYQESHQFFSYRRTGSTGRMASLIWMSK